MAYQFFTGTVIGFLIALTVGPITIIGIRRSFIDGFIAGIISGAGAAVGAALFGSLTAFNLTLISSLFTSYALIFKFVAGTYLMYLGLRSYFTNPFSHPDTYLPMSHTQAFLSTLFLAFASPLTIAAFPFWLAAYSISNLTYAQAFLLTAGFLVGSFIWWALLTTTCAILASRCNTDTLKRINQVSSILIGLSGLVSIFILFISW